MSHSFIAYIDESGDDGLDPDTYREPGNGGGASNWFAICACVMRATDSLNGVQWRNEVKSGTGKNSKGEAIHFHTFNHGQKRFACQHLSTKPIRFSAALSFKRDIPDGTYIHKNQYYFYVTRYVIERVSWLCRDSRPKVRHGDGRVKIVFSRRGGLSYEGFKDYLLHLKGDPSTSIHWPVIDIDGIDAQDHSRVAGLQLADSGARAIIEAFEPDLFGNVEGQYLNLLRDVIYSRKGNYLSYGLKILPTWEQATLTPAQAANIAAFR
ncbi:MAG: DUF3800 domain-containing protein [Amphiplicatus sp.]|nr:DUF3800 domain-containing protein [Amphiplicatus sp.]